MSDDPVICYCFGTTRDQVREHFKKPGATLEQLIGETQITKKCTACSLDLDMLLEEIQAERLGTVVPSAMSAGRGRFIDKVDRADSGFFICDGTISTQIRLSNYPPMYDDKSFCTDYSYILSLFDEQGHCIARPSGRLPVGSELTLNLGALGAPRRGWFLLHQMPDGPGYYGTTRPQVFLKGHGWAACYHTQFHSDATRKGRRADSPAFVIDGKTRMRVAVINGSANPTKVRFRLEGTDCQGEAETVLLGNGSTIFDVDAAMPTLSGTGPALLHVISDEPTRKILINVHPDGTWGVDHFPNIA